MARKVFFSFQYDDVLRAMKVRNSNVINANPKVGFIDKAEFEKLERTGDSTVKAWIDAQLIGTTVTVVLIGANTDKSKWVKYEIEKSIKRGNGLLTIDISKIPDFNKQTSDFCGMKIQGYKHYRWNTDNGRENLGVWVEEAAKAAGKP